MMLADDDNNRRPSSSGAAHPPQGTTPIPTNMSTTTTTTGSGSSGSGSTLQRAVAFLRTPSIAANPDGAAKVRFLRTTGMTAEEVRNAFRLVQAQLEEEERQRQEQEQEQQQKQEGKGGEGKNGGEGSGGGDAPTSPPPKATSAASAAAVAVGTPDTAPMPVTPDRHGDDDDDDDDDVPPSEQAAMAVAAAAESSPLCHIDDAPATTAADATNRSSGRSPDVPPVHHVSYLSSGPRSRGGRSSAASSTSSSTSSSCSSVSSDEEDQSHPTNSHTHVHEYAAAQRGCASSSHASGSHVGGGIGGGGGGGSSTAQKGWREAARFPGRTKLARLVAGRHSDDGGVGVGVGDDDGDGDDDNNDEGMGQGCEDECKPLPVDYAGVAGAGAVGGGAAIDDGGDANDHGGTDPADPDKNRQTLLPHQHQPNTGSSTSTAGIGAARTRTAEGGTSPVALLPVETVDGPGVDDDDDDVDDDDDDDDWVDGEEEEEEEEAREVDVSGLTGNSSGGDSVEGGGLDGEDDNQAMISDDEEGSERMDSIDLGGGSEMMGGGEVRREGTGANPVADDPDLEGGATEQSRAPSRPPPLPTPRANLASASRRMLLQIQERRYAAMLAREELEAKNGNVGEDAAAGDGGGNRASRFFARAVRKASRDRVGSAAEDGGGGGGGGGLPAFEEGMGPTLAAAIAADEEMEAAEMPNTDEMNGADMSFGSDGKPTSTSPSTGDEGDGGAAADLNTSGTSAENVRSRADSKTSEDNSQLEQCEWLETSSEEDSARSEGREKINGEVDVEEDDDDLPSQASVPSESSSISSNAGSAPAEEVYGEGLSDAEEQDEEIRNENETAPMVQSDTPPPSEYDTPMPSRLGEAPSAATETTPEKTPEVNDANRSGSFDLEDDVRNRTRVAAAAAMGAVAIGGTTAAAVAAAEGKGQPPTTLPPAPKHKEEGQQDLQRVNTATSSSLGLLISSLRTAATKPPTEPNGHVSQEAPETKAALETFYDAEDHEIVSQLVQEQRKAVDTNDEDSHVLYEEQPYPKTSEGSLQEHISAISTATSIGDEDEISDEIQSTVPPPPKRSDESLLRTGDAGIYKGESLPHGFGSMTFTNGTRYVGNWVHGEPSGEGTLYLANGEAKRGRWKDGAFEQFDRFVATDREDEGSTPSLPSSESSSDSGHSGYEHADDELSAQDMKRVDVSARRSIDPSGFDRTDDPSVCSTLEPSKRKFNDAVSAASDPERSVEITAIADGALAATSSVEDTFYQEDRDLEKGETESATQRRRKCLREKRCWSCVPFLLVLLGAACLGGGIYVWYLYLGPGKQSANSTSIASNGIDPGDTFSGPTSISSGNIASSSRPRDDGGSEDVV